MASQSHIVHLKPTCPICTDAKKKGAPTHGKPACAHALYVFRKDHFKRTHYLVAGGSHEIKAISVWWRHGAKPKHGRKCFFLTSPHRECRATLCADWVERRHTRSDQNIYIIPPSAMYPGIVEIFLIFFFITLDGCTYYRVQFACAGRYCASEESILCLYVRSMSVVTVLFFCTHSYRTLGVIPRGSVCANMSSFSPTSKRSCIYVYMCTYMCVCMYINVCVCA